jgi:hypothetical protein
MFAKVGVLQLKPTEALLGFTWPICATVEEKECRKIPAARVYRCRYITRNKPTKETRPTDEAKAGKENNTTDETGWTKPRKRFSLYY